MSSPAIICFGEMLWDVLPEGKQPGGAPLNVAIHLRNLGLPASLISRVGNDVLGVELLDFVRSRGLNTELIQSGGPHPTGTVEANVTNRKEVVYDIVQPVAWDYIEYDETLATAVIESQAMVYGSLAARHYTTAETLFRLLERASLKVCDVNLRVPHYTQHMLERLLATADLVKMNHHELALIASWYGDSTGEEKAITELAQRYTLQTVCVTKGEDGATLYTNGTFHRSPSVPVEVRDTIGSGDAFLAALLYGLLRQDHPEQCLRFASAAGALVATYQGATPLINEAQIRVLMVQK